MWAQGRAAPASEQVVTVPAPVSEARAPWSDSFDGVLRLLGHSTGGWGEIAHDKKAITVQGLQPKAEGDLRHFLEAVVVQVNSEVAEPASESESQTEPADPQELEDQEMTATLRSFGEPQAGGPDAA